LLRVCASAASAAVLVIVVVAAHHPMVQAVRAHVAPTADARAPRAVRARRTRAHERRWRVRDAVRRVSRASGAPRRANL